MSDFIWTQQLSIGVPAMDADHRRIINYMNALAQAAERRASFPELDIAFRQLKEFTRKHFSDEEKLMSSIGYDRIATHKAIHSKLLGELDQHYDDFTHSQRLGDGLFRFLAFWLKSHICGIDRKYSEQITSRPSGALT